MQVAAQTLQAFFTGGGTARGTPSTRWPRSTSARRFSTRPRCATSTPSSNTSRPRARFADRRCRPSGTSCRSSTSPTPRRSTGRKTRSRIPLTRRSSTTSSRSRRSSERRAQIGGFTIMNDWSARDLQRAEMRVGLGPAKGKDFATSLGPVLVTPDEFDGTSAVDGRARERRGALAGESRRPLPLLGRDRRARLAQHAPPTRRRSRLRHCRDGCILEHGDGRWLQRGDVVELEVEGIGILRNRVA